MRLASRTSERFGRVTVFPHRKQLYCRYREDGLNKRHALGDHGPESLLRAAFLSAKLIAKDAGIDLSTFARQALNLHVSATSVGDAGADLRELRDSFLAHHDTVLHSATATVNRYRTALQHLLDFAAKNHIRRTDEISVAEFIAYLRKLNISPNGHLNSSRRNLRDKGLKYVIEVGRALFRFGQKTGRIPQHLLNPFTQYLGGIKIRDAKPTFVFSAKDELNFLQACDARNLPIHFTQCKTGTRSGELAHIFIEDVDFNGGWLHVRSKPELGWITKTNTERKIPLPPELVELLQQMIGSRKAGPLFLRRNASTDKSESTRLKLAKQVVDAIESAQALAKGPLSRASIAALHRQVWRSGGGMDADGIARSFHSIAKNAGIVGACPKSWRHTFATLLQEANVDLLIRQDVMGHKPADPSRSPAMMTAVYTHTSSEMIHREICRALRLRPASLSLAAERVSIQDNRGAHV